MLAINGGIRVWYVRGITNMRYGKYRLFSEIEAAGGDPYNGDAYLFISKNRRTMKIVRYINHKRYLYDITYDPGYKYMKVVKEDGKPVYELDYKYLVALIECPVKQTLNI